MPFREEVSAFQKATQPKGKTELFGQTQLAGRPDAGGPRLDRVLQLREAIRNGSYQVSAEELAMSLSRHGARIGGTDRNNQGTKRYSGLR